jgi:hypothetical protein
MTIAADERAREAANAAADREFRKLADKIKRLAGECEGIAATDMGPLYWSLAAKFHYATNELTQLNRTLQQVVTEMDRAGLVFVRNHCTS